MGTAGTVASNGEGAATTGAEESLEPPEGLRLTELSLRWTAFRVNRTFRSVYELNRARNFEEFREAASYFDIPAQNLVYADAAGNIGYQTPGLIPIRSRGDGTFPVPGWADDYQWQGYIPFDELPFVFNPEKDYIVTANNAVTSSNYRYHITSDYNHGYRAKRIAEMVRRDSPEVGLDDVAAQQGDTQYAAASEILPYLLDLDPEDVDIRGESVSAEDISEAQALLEAWNGRMEVDDPAAALYGVFYPALLAELTHDELPDSGGLRERMLGTTSRLHSMLRGILPRPRNPWWDNVLTPDTRETRDEILLRSLARALLEARETLGNNPDNWRWGEIHTITFRNQTLGDSGISVIESLFNRGPYEVPSGLDQVFSADFDPTDPYEVVNHASMRQIIDLSDLGASRMIHTTGQSGHPYNRHYADFAPMWRDVEFHAHMWDRGELLDGDFDLLRLDPES
jgi:penicillin amidase